MIIYSVSQTPYPLNDRLYKYHNHNPSQRQTILKDHSPQTTGCNDRPTPERPRAMKPLYYLKLEWKITANLSTEGRVGKKISQILKHQQTCREVPGKGCRFSFIRLRPKQQGVRYQKRWEENFNLKNAQIFGATGRTCFKISLNMD